VRCPIAFPLVAFALAGVRLLGAPIDDYERAMDRGRHADAAEIAVAQATASSSDSVWAFHAARALAELGRTDEAAEWAFRAAERGYGGVRSFETDPSLDPIREHPRFAEAIAMVRARAAARFEEFRAAAAEHESVVVLPPGHDPAKPSPLLIVLHGTGGTGRGMADAWTGPAAAVGAILVAPDALRPAFGSNGFSWTYRDESEWLVLRELERARAAYAVGPVILAGYSQGANIALMLGQTCPARFDAVIPVSGHYEPGVAEVPASGDDRPAWYLLIGSRDGPASTYLDAERAFRSAGMDVRRRTLAGRGHEFPTGPGGERELTTALRWCLRTAERAERASTPANPAGGETSP
jgi:predicted esterase